MGNVKRARTCDRSFGVLTCLLLACWLVVPATAAERVHFLIPAGPGGGLDSTARALGKALQVAALRSPVSFENMIGGGGGRAMAHFVETADRQSQTLLVNSTPLVVRSLQGLFPHSFRDLKPVAGLVAEYGAIVVRADADITRWSQLVERLAADPRAVPVGGGSARGSLDHIVISQALSVAGVDPRRVRYLPYDAGAKAMLALLGGEIVVLSTGLGETLSYAASGEVRVLAVTAPERAPQLPQTPTLKELGTPFVFANWRGVFAAPGLSAGDLGTYEAEIRSALASDSWQAASQRYGWTTLGLYGAEFTDYLIAQEAQLRATLTELGFLPSQ